LTDRIIDFSSMFKISTCIALLIVSSSIAAAHAILVTSTPKAKEIVTGPKVVLSLTFNSRLDQGRSSLVLEKSDHSSSKVPVTVDSSSPEKLTSMPSSLAPGAYKLHWQVLAVDGHVTRGELSFQVK
jgi:methionine-rich copper-binding protein CopC